MCKRAEKCNDLLPFAGKVKGSVFLKYLKLFVDFEELIAPLDDAERGRLFSAVLSYARDREEPSLTGNERFLWPAARQQLDKTWEQYEKTVAANTQNARKGGRPRNRKAVDLTAQVREDEAVKGGYFREQDTPDLTAQVQEGEAVKGGYFRERDTSALTAQARKEEVISSLLRGMPEQGAFPAAKPDRTGSSAAPLPKEKRPGRNRPLAADRPGLTHPLRVQLPGENRPVRAQAPSPERAPRAPLFRTMEEPPAASGAEEIPLPREEDAPPAEEFPLPREEDAPPAEEFPLPGEEDAPPAEEFPLPGEEDAPPEEEKEPEEKTAIPQCLWARPDQGIAISLPLPQGNAYPVFDYKVRQWEEKFPRVQVREELKKIRTWLLQNPQRQQGKDEIIPFILRWLEKNQKRAASPAPRGKETPAPSYDLEAIRRQMLENTAG